MLLSAVADWSLAESLAEPRGSCSASCGGGTRTEGRCSDRGGAQVLWGEPQDADESRRGGAGMGCNAESIRRAKGQRKACV